MRVRSLPLFNVRIAGLLLAGAMQVRAAAQGRPDLVWNRGAHFTPVNHVAYSPDGRLVFSGSGDSAKIWRVKDGMLLRTVQTGASALAVSPDGATLAVSNRGVILYRISDGTRIRLMTGSTAYYTRALAFSPDGQILASGGDDQLVRLWRVSDGALLSTMAGHTGAVTAVAISLDGQFCASASGLQSDFTVRTWRIADGQLVRTITGPSTGDGYTLHFSPNGRGIFIGARASRGFEFDRLELHQLSDGSLVRAYTFMGGLNSFALSPDGATLAVVAGCHPGAGGYCDSNAEAAIVLIRVSDGAKMGVLGPGVQLGTQALDVAFSANGQTLVTGHANDAVQLWRLSDQTLTGVLTPPGASGPAWKMAVSPDGALVASAVFGHAPILLRRMSDGAITRVIPADSVTGLAFTPDSAFLASSYGTSDYAMTRVSDGALIRVFRTNSYQTGDVAVSPDGQLIAGSSQAGTMVWRTADGTLVSTLPGGGYDVNVFSPDGRYFARATSSGADVILHRISDWSVARVLSIGSRAASLSFSRDSHLLAIGGSSDASLWEVESGRRIRTIGASGSARLVAFSQDGEVLAVGDTGDSAAHLRLWSVVDGSLPLDYDQETGYPGGDSGGIQSLTYTPDDKFVVYGRSDGTVAAFLNPYHNTIIPNHGGNTGNVTVRIITSPDFPVADGTTVTLHNGVNSDITIPTTRVSDYVLTGTFDLRGAPLGKRDVVINAPGGQRTYPQGFTVDEGVAPQVSVQVVGRHSVRAGASTSYHVLITNQGNNDTGGIPVVLGIPKWIDARLGVELIPPPPLDIDGPIDWSQVPVWLDPSGNNYAFLWAPFVWAYGLTDLAVSVVIPDIASNAHRVFNLWTWVDAPWLKALAFDTAGGLISGQWDDDLVDCWKEIGKLALKTSLGLTLDAAAETAFIKLIRSRLTSAFRTTLGRIGVTGLDIYAQSLIMELSDTVASVAAMTGKALTRDEWARIVLDTSKFLFDAATGAIKVAPCFNVFTRWPVTDFPGQSITSGDPNELAGPSGFGTPQWVGSSVPLHYAVHFLNEPTATAPAAEVVVTDHTDATLLDTTTVQIGAISFGDRTVTPTQDQSLPIGKRQYSADVDLRPKRNLIVRITAVLDMLTGDLTWHFVSLDPGTMQPPTDPTAGFLDPGQEGSVFFSVVPKSTVLTGTVVNNQASIKFDFNDWINTNVWFNTIDADKATSLVAALASSQNSTSFTVRWAGQDVGSGVRDFTIYSRDNDGPWTPWLTSTTDTSATFTGIVGHTYSFYSQARDNAYNLEDTHQQPDTVTKIVSGVSDVSGQVSVTRSGFRRNASTGRYVQTVTLKNTSGSAITGPISLVLDGLGSNAGLFNKTGTTAAMLPAGSPYIDVTAGTLNPGGSVSVVLEFTNPSNQGITYSTRVLAGTGSR